MKFVIELDDFACGTAERQVMRRGWEREANRPQSAQLCHQNPSRASGGRAAPIPNRSNMTPERSLPTR
jgi:hypothetical protein